LIGFSSVKIHVFRLNCVDSDDPNQVIGYFDCDLGSLGII